MPVRWTTKDATFFATPTDWRAWLEQHHTTKHELVVGFHKRDTGKRSIMWSESVDEALCFGWIDGKRQSLGATAYAIRFTPRKPSSMWSRINVDKVAMLRAAGSMRPAGEAAYALRTEAKTYAYERNADAVLPQAFEAKLRANKKAAAYFDTQPPHYRRTVTHWVISAKKDETRERRLRELIACCAAGRWVPAMAPPSKGLRVKKAAK